MTVASSYARQTDRQHYYFATQALKVDEVGDHFPAVPKPVFGVFKGKPGDEALFNDDMPYIPAWASSGLGPASARGEKRPRSPSVPSSAGAELVDEEGCPPPGDGWSE